MARVFDKPIVEDRIDDKPGSNILLLPHQSCSYFISGDSFLWDESLTLMVAV
jgi:hypothetical protein